MKGRSYVTPDDVRSIAVHVLAHRIILNADAQFGGTTTEEVMQEILKKTQARTV